MKGDGNLTKVDLITGFLGSGKTTFIKHYASYLVKQGYKVGIIENDFGAVNVDMMLKPDDVKYMLKLSSTNLNMPPNRQGWGLLNIEKLLNMEAVYVRH